MANLYFPQLTSGALAQYPIHKTKVGRTVKNILPDGTLIAYPDPSASRVVWQLGYSNLSSTDLAALTSHFNSCQGRLHAFTFIDPTDNMLVNSANLSGSEWLHSSMVQITGNSPDLNDGTSAFSLTNTGDASQDVTQMLAVPANYSYCFSAYALSAQPSTVGFVRQGSTTQQVDALPVGPNWNRIVSNGRLTDNGSTFTVAIRLAPGQQISIYGLQLEAQLAPSRYRPTLRQGGVYSNAHWGTDQLPVSADAPASFSTAFSIEASI
ncbi:MAG: DUF2460 domain-containing protein [Acidobacteriota bacterium]|nr:DUF2460 domain-containing protein [Acidobacteriota bacterium]